MARFFDKVVPAGTGEDGLQAYASRTYLDLYHSASQRIIRPARETDFKRFPAEYEAYRLSREPDHDGFPLAAWTQLSDSARQTLVARGIHTVEKFVESDVSQAPREIKEAHPRAKEFLARIKDEAPHIASKLTASEEEISVLKKENAELRDRIGTLEAMLREANSDGGGDGDGEKPRRGRPPKNAD